MKARPLTLALCGGLLFALMGGCRQEEKSSGSAKTPPDPELTRLKEAAIESVKNEQDEPAATQPAPAPAAKPTQATKSTQAAKPAPPAPAQPPTPNQEQAQRETLRPRQIIQRRQAQRQAQQQKQMAGQQQKPGQQPKPGQPAPTAPLRRIPPSAVSLPETPTAAQKAKEKAAAEADRMAADMEKRQQALDAAAPDKTPEPQ